MTVFINILCIRFYAAFVSFKGIFLLRICSLVMFLTVLILL